MRGIIYALTYLLDHLGWGSAAVRLTALMRRWRPDGLEAKLYAFTHELSIFGAFHRDETELYRTVEDILDFLADEDLRGLSEEEPELFVGVLDVCKTITQLGGETADDMNWPPTTRKALENVAGEVGVSVETLPESPEGISTADVVGFVDMIRDEWDWKWA